MESPLVRLQLSSSSQWANKKRRTDSEPDDSSRRGAGDGDDDDDGDQYQSLKCPLNEKKNFFVVLSGRTTLSYLSIPLNSLFYLREGFLEESFHPGVYKVAYGMDCFCWKDTVYLIGGCDLPGRTKTDFSFGKKKSDLCRGVMSFEILPFELKGSPGSCKRSPMHSGKEYPIIFEHQDILYVLSRCARYPGNYFESYNPKTDKWDILEPPPFFNGDCKYYSVIPTFFSYVFIDNKICISIRNSASFAYDVVCKKWEPCCLFGGFQDFLYYRGSFKDLGLCGSAFDFHDKGIVVGEGNDKYLISTLIYSDLAAVAYEISGGSVARKQILLSFPELMADHIIFRSLVALGQDYFCLTFTEYYYGDTWLLLVTFQASPKKASEEYESDKFFDAKVCNKCRIKILEEYAGLVSPEAFAV